ncbi:P-loop containing nucleoside triphosphate hydrolase protein [Polychytrium aggregatum]|uniref:P-loop containing nucleoside triphosphate hydrolase protein n=1 Tax=Polychytrium aggregatum TaxID=110093 RepID=UPI0022FDC324|nr:P-loop containing nucleoside triphosphate hydrolase protein [Polychytrium aggregatum]KAI9199776.1 P-loop containing nucleoside triphosphate hydrolase protein [Polychytrium aggregatum]
MKKKRAESVPNYTDIIAGLKDIYKSKIKPVEQLLSFDQFSTPSLTDADLTAKPIVLLMGQYSVGKSTFIKYILEKEYPGCHIGPEPTTDRFIAILGGEDRIIPGNAAAVDRDLPFTSLSRFGASFLQKFQVSYTSSPILESVTLIDTPGVLSGEKQRIGRSYDFSGVMEYFAARADAILLLFDAHKLDISDEFKDCIMGLKGNEEKVKVILNKADMVNGQQLLRVYGALMWSLGKVLNTPEVMRVYIGSFWDQPLRYRDCEALLSAEQEDLLADLRSLSTNSTMRKINDIVKRASMVKIHALIISHLKQEMPGFFGKSSKQSELLANLAAEFTKLEHLHRLPRGDFPNVEEFKSKLSLFKIDKFPKLDKKLMATLDTVRISFALCAPR